MNSAHVPASSRAATITWRLATVAGVVTETPRARTLVLDVPGWPGHRAGQHVDVRLTAQDGSHGEFWAHASQEPFDWSEESYDAHS